MNATKKTDDHSINKYGTYLICLLDLLNQGEQLRQLKEIPLQDTPETRKKIDETFGCVLKTRGQFRGFIDSYYKGRPNFCSLADGTEDKDQKEYLEFCQQVIDLKIKEQYFSDTLILYIPLFRSEASSSTILAMFSAIAATMLCSLAEKIPVRGAIHIGYGAEFQRGDIYGPVLADAHYLESKKANYPRIIVSEATHKYLHNYQCQSHNRLINDDINKYLSECKKFICKDSSEDSLILDYAQKPIIKHDAWEAMLREAESFADTEYRKYRPKKMSRAKNKRSGMED